MLAIYIRDVTSAKRDAEVHEIANHVSAQGIPMVLVENSVKAAYHAAEHNLISRAAVQIVRADAEHDAQRSG